MRLTTLFADGIGNGAKRIFSQAKNAFRGLCRSVPLITKAPLTPHSKRSLAVSGYPSGAFLLLLWGSPGALWLLSCTFRVATSTRCPSGALLLLSGGLLELYGCSRELSLRQPVVAS